MMENDADIIKPIILFRTLVFARLMASLFIGSSIGPFISSLILKVCFLIFFFVSYHRFV
jgi:hypothetical protein